MYADDWKKRKGRKEREKISINANNEREQAQEGHDVACIVGGADVNDAEMQSGVEGGAEVAGSDDGLTVEALPAIVIEKVDFMAVYPLMRDPLRAVGKPRLTLHEVLERLTALSYPPMTGT